MANISRSETLERDTQRLGEEDRASRSAPRGLMTTETARPVARLSLDPRLPSSSRMSRTTPATKTSMSTRWIPRAETAAGRRRPALARSHQSEGRARDAVQRAEVRSRRHLYRPQRSRQILARSLQTQNLHRRAHADPQEHRPHRRLDLRPPGKSAPGPARARTTGDQEILRVDADGFTPIYTCNVFESLRRNPVP